MSIKDKIIDYKMDLALAEASRAETEEDFKAEMEGNQNDDTLILIRCNRAWAGSRVATLKSVIEDLENIDD